MLDCIKLTTKLNDLAKANIVLDQVIDRYVSSDQNAIVKQKTELLLDIYRARKLVKEKIQNIHDRIKAEEFLEQLENRAERVTIMLGQFGSVDKLVETLEQQGNVVVDEAKRMMIDQKFTISDTETEADLAILPAGYLGFGGKLSYKLIIKKARDRGLQLCPLEAGPQLRLQYSGEKVRYRAFFVASEPIDGYFFPNIFSVESNNFEPSLRASLALDYQDYNAGDYFVFRLP